jgi:signal transduction histidine kinase/CheY-like chemotaxis protein
MNNAHAKQQILQMTPASKLEPGVQRELFRLGYKNILASIVGGFVSASLLGLTLWSMRPSRAVALWVICAFTTNAFAWFLKIVFRKHAQAMVLDELHRPSLNVLAKWRLMHTLFVVASACVWAGICTLLDISDPRANVLILVSVLSVLAFAASSHGVHNILSFVLSTLISIPIILMFLHNAFTQSVLPIAVLFVMFGVACTLIAINANRTMIEAIRLRLSNQELAQQRALEAGRADQANRDKSSFLAAAAHDMRQPVHALLMLQGLLRQTKEPHQHQAILDQMQIATSTIGQLFDSVMELSRLESGTAKARMEPVNIEAFLADRVAQHLPAARQKGLRIRVRKSRNALGAWVNADRVLLMRLVDNLLGNALRYTEQGGVLISLRKHSARKLFLEIWDTGIGIPASEIGRIFDPYVQLGNEIRNREKGLGLGLAIVKNSAQLMGLTMEVKSRPGRGSCFRLLLSRVAAPPIEVPKQEASQVVLDKFSLKGQNVLIIEDDPLVTKALLAVLELWGAETRHVMSYDDLALGSWSPNIILCDQRLPGLHDGLDTLDRLKAAYPFAACILQTGEISPEIPLKAQSKGFGLLPKPVTIEVLSQTIRRALRAATKGL